MDEKEKNLNSLLDDALNDLLEGEEAEVSPVVPDIKESLRKITEVTGGGPAGDYAAGSSASNKNGKKTCDETASGSNIGMGVDEEEMNRFFESMTAQLKAELPKIDPDEAQAKISESVPQIFDLMQNLLSKELLYPALKDLSPKFDEWLKKNTGSLNKADKRRYIKQKDIINEIIYTFDNESLDSQERFEKNLDLMEKMQSLGSPPQELTVPEGMDRCSIM